MKTEDMQRAVRLYAAMKAAARRYEETPPENLEQHLELAVVHDMLRQQLKNLLNTKEPVCASSLVS